MSEQDEQTEQLPEVVEIEGGGWKATCQTCGEWTVTKPEKISAIRALSAHMGSCPKSPRKTIGEPLSGPEKAEEEEELEYRRELRELGRILPDFGVSDQLIGRIKRRVLEDPSFLDSTGEFEELLRSEGVTNEHKVKVATKQIFKAIRPNVLRGFSEDDREERGRRPPYYDEGDSFLREELKDLKAELKATQERLDATEKKALQDQISGLYSEVHELKNRDPFEEIRKYDEYAESRGYTRTGGSTVDLIRDGLEKADRRADQIIDKLAKPGGEFKPEVTRTPDERRAAAAEIQVNLQKREEILAAENELLAAWYKGENPTPQKEKASP
jgi:hypothetical protein